MIAQKDRKKEGLSDDMKDLLAQKNQIQEWLSKVEQRVWELEGNYLDSTPMGNIIRGWDLDGKPLIHKRSDDKEERLFSYSSYQFYQEKKTQERVRHQTAYDMSGRYGSDDAFNPNKKNKRRKDDWDGGF